MFSMRFGSFGMGKFLATEANQTREIWVSKYHSNTRIPIFCMGNFFYKLFRHKFYYGLPS